MGNECTEKVPSSMKLIRSEISHFIQKSFDARERQPDDSQTRSFCFPHETEAHICFLLPVKYVKKITFSFGIHNNVTLTSY